MKKLIPLIALFALTACTDSNKTIRVLEDQGFTDIEITGYEPFACSKDDDFATGFRAKSVTGKTVTGTVCSGFLKGATVRFD